jgi:hydrogenase nickel incorporation protein HypB
MCVDCGCGDATGARVTVFGPAAVGSTSAGGHGHDDGHHDHGHHDHGHHDQAHRSVGPSRTVAVEQAILAKNDLLAERNRRWLADRAITAVNLMSSPGSGKTSLLVRTIGEVAGARGVSVVEGDQETSLDAERIRATGCRVVQINTGAGCHLDADMLSRGLTALAPAPGSLVFIENVGNLVCPALFDLGETGRAVIVSVTEGDDKPLKYPHMFGAADVVLLNKIDLLPYVDFDPHACAERARSINPNVEVISLSAKTGEGVDRWCEWLFGMGSAR